MTKLLKLICACLLLLNFSVKADVRWLAPDELDFDIYDFRLEPSLVLYESADVYYYKDHTLLPFYLVTGMLEVNLNYGPKKGLISGRIGDKNIQMYLKGANRANHANTATTYASQIDDELYLDIATFEQLLNAKITVILRDLAIEFSAQDELFPIQKRLLRKDKKVVKPKGEYDPTYDFLVEDQYRLYTPPKGHVSLSARKNRLNEQLNLNVQTYNDLLYHGSHLSLAQNADSELIARFNMQRSQTAPDKKILGLINNYAFGDVSASNTRLQTGYSGLGLTFGSHQTKYSAYFGKVNIEENAPAGWQTELYKNGFLIETGTATDDGRVVFNDVETTYGTNRFQIKLYGPYGEEQIIDREVLIGHNMIKSGQFNFNGGVIDTSSSLFNNDESNQQVSTPAAFLQTEFGINEKTSIGLSYFAQKNTDDTTLQESVLSLSRQLPNALADFNIFVQEQDKYKFDLNILGSFNNSFRYSAGAFSNKNYDNRDTVAALGEQRGFRAGLTARIGAFGLSLNGYSKSNSYQTSGVTEDSQFDDLNFIISSRFRKFNITNTINYNYNSLLDSSVKLTDMLAISSPIGDRWYIRASANINIEHGAQQQTELDSIDFNATWRTPAQIYASFNAQYYIDDRYRLSSNVSVRKQKYNLVFGTSYSNETKWQVTAGLTFNIDYDYHNGKLNLQSEYSAASSTLDLLTFIDNNQNARFDEFDEPLSGVQFGIKPYWRDIRSNNYGMTYLPGLGHNAPIKVHFNTMDTKSSSLKPVNDNFRFYTHAGGVSSLDVPFNYATSIDGLLNDHSRGQKAKFVPMQVINSKGRVVAESNSDIENYYLFDDVWPGTYTLRVTPDFLTQRQLKAHPTEIKFNLSGSEPIISLQAIDISDQTDTQFSQPEPIKVSQSKRNGFYSIQFGAYADREYCHMRTQALTNAGIEQAFYSMQTQYCTVMAGRFDNISDAKSYLSKIQSKVRSDAYVRLFKTIRNTFAIKLRQFDTQSDCQRVQQRYPLIKSYIINQPSGCQVYIGDFLNKELAQTAFLELPIALRKGAEIVEF